MVELARVLIYGDIHLNSKNYGAHINYPEESLEYFREITKKAKELNATHLIGTGDLTFGRFHTLEYRDAVEAELQEQYNIVDGNRFELEGNHDKATYGMTEYDYYIKKGLLKKSANMTIGNVNISMVDYNKYYDQTIIPAGAETEINVVVAHNYFKFKDTRLPDYGKAIELDSFVDWFGIDYLICGHIHSHHLFDGLIIKDGHGHPLAVHYLGCMSRPAYREGNMDEEGNLVMLTIRDNGEMQYDIIDIPLRKLEDSFNLDRKKEQKEAKNEKEQRVDISDIVQELNLHQRNVGNPEDIIDSMQGIDDKYKKKAIELLKAGQA